MSAPVLRPVIFNVRHAQSVTNVNTALRLRISDPAVWLTEHGHFQARKAGEFLARHFAALPPEERPQHVRIIRSSYKRAVQTAAHIEEALRTSGVIETISTKEDARLRELEFGYVDAMTSFAPHVEWLSNILRYQGYKYLAKRYGGESPASMEPRVRLMLAAIFRDFTQRGITHFVVVSHGLTSRVLTSIRFNYNNDWFEAEPNPDNAAIRLLDTHDRGYIFPNDKGQWDPTRPPPEALEAGDPLLNPHGLFFSPRQMAVLVDAQKTDPTLMQRMTELLDATPDLTATAAMAAFNLAE